MDKRTGYIVEELFRLGAMSNQELSKHMELSPASITHLLQPLVSRGILEERPPEAYPEDSLQTHPDHQGQRRRRKITVYPNRNHGYVLCAEFAQSNLIFHKVNFDLTGVTDFEDAMPLPARKEDLISSIKTKIDQIRQGDSRPLLAVGFTISGIIDSDGSKVILSSHQSYLVDLPLPKMLKDELGIPVTLSNDANSLAVFERFAGKGKNIRHFFALYINEGVGLGIFTNGKLYEGHLNRAGESGHWIMDPEGKQVPGSPRGSFEAYVSQAAIHQQLLEAGFKLKEDESYRTLQHELTVNQHPSVKAHRILDLVSEKTALLCANMVNIFAPEKIFIHGPLSDLGEAYLSRIKSGLRVYTASLRNSTMSEVVELSGPWKKSMCLGTAKCAIDAYLAKQVQETQDKDKIRRKKPVRLKPIFNTPPRRFSPPGSPSGQ